MAHKKYAFTFDAPVTTILVICYAAVYALDMTLRSRLPVPDGQTLISWLFSCSSMNLRAPLDYVRLFCHVLGSDGWSPLLLNSVLLLLLGRSIEESSGSLPLAVMLLLSALAAGVITCLIPSLSTRGPDALIFLMILLNFLICLSAGSISCSWILVFLAFTAFRSYGLIMPTASKNVPLMLQACIPLFVSLAGGIAGCLPAFLLLPKAGKRRPASQKKGKGRSSYADDEETLVGSLDV